MAELVRMPKMSDTMTEGVVSKWHKKVGDKIKTGDLVADIETDKATMEFESYQEGTLLYIGVEEGKAVPVDGILAVLGAPGEDYKPVLEAESKTAPASKEASKPAPAPAKKEAPAAKPVAEKPATPASVKPTVQPVSPTVQTGDSKIKVSPLAKKLAEEKGINLSYVKGTGDEGRVVKRDIDWFKPGNIVASAAKAGSVLPEEVLPPVTEESSEEVAVSQMRKTIAKRLGESMFTAPHFYLTVEVDMDATVTARESINAVAERKISFNDFVIKAAAAALRHHPKVNSSWQGDTIRINHHIHIGVAVAVEEGLLVPVIRFADSKTLTEINTEVKTLSQKAKDKKLQSSEWEGNTFSISNLGMFGIEEFTAIINPPDACILAVGGIAHKPVVKYGTIVPGNVMKLTLSCDHRVVDGATGSRFMQALKGYLENPVILLGVASI